MKKFSVLFLALVMCLSLCSASFAEEAPQVEEITVEIDETYVEAALGEDYCYAYIPSDWLALEAEYSDENGELLGSFVNADGTQLVAVTYTTVETPCTYESLYNEAVAAGTSASLVVVNGFEFQCMAAAADDNIVMLANFIADEEGTSIITFTFTFPAADAEAFEIVANNILGSFNFYEAVE